MWHGAESDHSLSRLKELEGSRSLPWGGRSYHNSTLPASISEHSSSLYRWPHYFNLYSFTKAFCASSKNTYIPAMIWLGVFSVTLFLVRASVLNNMFTSVFILHILVINSDLFFLSSCKIFCLIVSL